MFLSAVLLQHVVPSKAHVAEFAGHGGGGDSLARSFLACSLWSANVVIMPWQALRCQVLAPLVHWLNKSTRDIWCQAPAPSSQPVLWYGHSPSHEQGVIRCQACELRRLEATSVHVMFLECCEKISHHRHQRLPNVLRRFFFSSQGSFEQRRCSRTACNPRGVALQLLVVC